MYKKQQAPSLSASAFAQAVTPSAKSSSLRLVMLTKLLNRPSNEKPLLLVPVGYPANDAQVPGIRRKDKEDVRA